MFHKMTVEQAKKVMDVHFYGTFYCCQAVMPGMREREYGKIVNISSTSAFGNIGQANYAASKGGMIAMTKSIAAEVASRGITANAIAPGFIKTPMTDVLPEELKKNYDEAFLCSAVGKGCEVE